ncbi:DUF1802 family protein [Leptolyngbya sp. FACHB-16]|nr:DUF1802 family protein [Leptolyngbya sp. FACHB-8]MBD2155796.1 DUF1802 family protein [Leptolyngbya sp. FACHB-16]
MTQPTLKEWAVVVAALEYGHTILLLRKGGIRETGGTFAIQEPQFWLFPTYEHQKAQWLKPEYGHLLQTAPAAPPTGTPVPPPHVVASWAEVTHTAQITTEDVAEALYPFHVWSPELVSKRLTWKPQQPLYGVLLRVYRLEQGLELEDQPAYGGCKSWLKLPLPPMEAGAAGCMPVLSNDVYDQKVRELSAIAHFTPL